MSERTAFRFGYRKLFYDIDNDETGNSFDGSFQGPFIGVGWVFGGSPEPVAAAAAPAASRKGCPAASPAATPPGDADKDGVTDDKDRCPNTTVGIQVDQIGCFREVTLRGLLFETDSGRTECGSAYPARYGGAELQGAAAGRRSRRVGGR